MSSRNEGWEALQVECVTGVANNINGETSPLMGRPVTTVEGLIISKQFVI